MPTSLFSDNKQINNQHYNIIIFLPGENEESKSSHLLETWLYFLKTLKILNDVFFI